MLYLLANIDRLLLVGKLILRNNTFGVAPMRVNFQHGHYYTEVAILHLIKSIFT